MNDEIIKNLAQSYANANVRIEQLERENAALKKELAPLRETVGVREDAVTSRNDITYWMSLMDKADKADQLERENAALREQLTQMRSVINDMADRFDRPEFKTRLFDDFMKMRRDLRRDCSARAKEAQP